MKCAATILFALALVLAGCGAKDKPYLLVKQDFAEAIGRIAAFAPYVTQAGDGHLVPIIREHAAMAVCGAIKDALSVTPPKGEERTPEDQAMHEKVRGFFALAEQECCASSDPGAVQRTGERCASGLEGLKISLSILDGEGFLAGAAKGVVPQIDPGSITPAAKKAGDEFAAAAKLSPMAEAMDKVWRNPNATFADFNAVCDKLTAERPPEPSEDESIPKMLQKSLEDSVARDCLLELGVQAMGDLVASCDTGQPGADCSMVKCAILEKYKVLALPPSMEAIIAKASKVCR
jgi:hypothetical protein